VQIICWKANLPRISHHF